MKEQKVSVREREKRGDRKGQGWTDHEESRADTVWTLVCGVVGKRMTRKVRKSRAALASGPIESCASCCCSMKRLEADSCRRLVSERSRRLCCHSRFRCGRGRGRRGGCRLSKNVRGVPFECPGCVWKAGRAYFLISSLRYEVLRRLKCRTVNLVDVRGSEAGASTHQAHAPQVDVPHLAGHGPTMRKTKSCWYFSCRVKVEETLE